MQGTTLADHFPLDKFTGLKLQELKCKHFLCNINVTKTFLLHYCQFIGQKDSAKLAFPLAL